MIIVTRKGTSSPPEQHAIPETAVHLYPALDWLYDTDTSALEGIPKKYWEATDTEIVEMSQELKAAADSLEFVQNKETRIEEVDLNSTTLIAAGVEYEGNTFSLSRQAQANLLGVSVAIAMGLPVSWPKEFNYLDDSGKHAFADTTEFIMFYGTAMATVESILNGGTVLKAAIRASEDQAALVAVVDNR